MTNSQSSSNTACDAGARLRPGSAASFGRLVFLAVARWRQRQRAKADLKRLAEAGDYLLQDVGLDPKQARENPAATLEKLSRR
ncbi:MAG TPA: hypothetical protein VGJ75_19540 [Dongiaceae bacterium]|jgi:uncharacterized protein YjiS (DUF1127 family)